MSTPIRSKTPALAGESLFVLSQPQTAVLKSVTVDEVSEMKKTLSALIQNIQELKQHASGDVQSAEGSIFGSQTTQLSPFGSWCMCLGGACFTTYSQWDTENFENNVENLLLMVGMVATAGHAAFVYWMNGRYKQRVEGRQMELVHFQGIFNSLEFLRQSARMAKSCLKTNPPANLSMIYPVFESYMNSLPSGNVPVDIAQQWAQVGLMIRSEQTEETQPNIRAVAQDIILPMIKCYIDGLLKRLTQMGFTPPQELREIVIEGNNGHSSQPGPSIPSYSVLPSLSSSTVLRRDDIENSGLSPLPTTPPNGGGHIIVIENSESFDEDTASS